MFRLTRLLAGLGMAKINVLKAGMIMTDLSLNLI
uniref:Uncharacterized protein n=1 Tax=Siphoviridae sp. ctFIm6 TaxID=2827818 RepID=A0A8S5SJF4_9CAUD|nr:MAG TPA: hypothetical protein [Siphoviridae sp. ctFIm6]